VVGIEPVEFAIGGQIDAETLHLLALSGRACATTIRPGERDQRATRQRVEGYLQRDRTCHLQPASLDEIAAELQISRRSLTASLRELRGRSWLDREREQRVSHATDLLKKQIVPWLRSPSNAGSRI